MNLEELEKELLKKEDFRKYRSQYDLAYKIGEMVVDARIKLGITQKKLAKMVGTKQPSIARLENGTTLPSLSFLDKIAKKMGTHLLAPNFAFLVDLNSANNSYSNNMDLEGYMAQSSITGIGVLDKNTETAEEKVGISSHN